jgi:Family of unknown function (DUF6263)
LFPDGLPVKREQQLSAGDTLPPHLEDEIVPRRRYWLLAALLLVIGLSAPITAQDSKDKAPPAKDKDKAAPVAPAAPAGDKVELKWKFEKDKPFFQEMTTQTQQDMQVMGMPVKQSQDQTFFFSWQFKEEDKDKNTVITQKIEGVKLTINVAGNPITFDSSLPTGQNTALGEFFRALVGTEFRLTLDKDNKVIDIKGREEFLKKLTAANQTMEPLLKAILTEEALKQMADPTFGITPPNAVAKGDTWTRETRLNLGPIGSYKGTFKYKYEGQDDKNKDLAKISVEITLVYEPPTADATQLPFRIKEAKLTSKNGKGTITFDIKKGRLEKSEQKIELEGKLTIEIAGMTTDVSLTQTQDSTIVTSDTPQVKKAAP